MPSRVQWQPEEFIWHLGSAWKNVRYLNMDALCLIPDIPYLFPPVEGPKDRSVLDCYGLKLVDSGDVLCLAPDPEDSEYASSDDSEYEQSLADSQLYDEDSILSDGSEWGLEPGESQELAREFFGPLSLYTE